MLASRILVIAATLLLPIRLLAQTETGQLTGSVSDASGAGVPGATVTVRSLGTGATRVFKTSTDGHTTLLIFCPAILFNDRDQHRFRADERRVNVAVGSRTAQDFILEVASTSTTVIVSESGPQIDTTTQTQSEVITQNQIRELPNLTRNPYQFVALAGNVSDAGWERGARDCDQRPTESSTNMLLDGASNNDEFAAQSASRCRSMRFRSFRSPRVTSRRNTAAHRAAS